MSQAGTPGSERIGGVHVDVTANTAPLRAGLEQAKAEASKAGEQIGAAVNRGVGLGPGAADNPFASSPRSRSRAGALTEFGRSLRSITAPMRTALAGLTSISSILLRISGLVGLIGGGLALLVKGIHSASQPSASVLKNLKDVQEAWARINETKGEEFERVLKQAGRPVNPGRFAKLNEELEDLRSKAKTLPDELQAASAEGIERRIVEKFAELRGLNIFENERDNIRFRAIEKEIFALERAKKIIEQISEKSAERNRIAREAVALAEAAMQIEADMARLRAIDKFDRLGGGAGNQLLQAINTLIAQRAGRDIR